MAKLTRISIVVIACLIGATVGALSLPVNDAMAADPACPGSWPGQGYDGPLRKQDHARIAYQDYFTDADGGRWFVIRSSDSNGYTTIRAYPATDDEYTANSPDEVCYLVVRRPGDTEDAAEPTQVVFATEPEEPEPPEPPAPLSLLQRLKRNADEFEYAIGKPGGSIKTASTAEPLTFNPVSARDYVSKFILGYVFEGLTEISWLTAEAKPALAERWERSDDGLTWTFHLRQDVKWRDGQPFTAHDVKFTYDRVVENHDSASVSHYVYHLQVFDEETGTWQYAEEIEVTVLDDHTVRFQLPHPFAPFELAMSMPIFPKHILESHLEAGSGALDTLWPVTMADPSQVIGTGPCYIEGYTPGASLRMRRNPDYWLKDAAGNPLPYLDTFDVVFVPDHDADLAKFRAGETDVHYVHRAKEDDIPALEPLQRAENFSLLNFGPGFGIEFLAFNMNSDRNPVTGEPYVAPEKLAWFTNQTFRQAMAHVVDKDRIIREAHHGRGHPQWSYISPSVAAFHNPNVRRYEYDVARANAMLDGLGWMDTNGDGVREDRHGNELTFSLAVNQGNQVRERIVRIISEDMARVGIRAEVQVIPFPLMVYQLLRSYDWEAVLSGASGGIEPHFAISIWHSAGRLHFWHPQERTPATAWEAEINDLYIKASRELDHGKRVALYHRIQEIAAENVPLIYTALPDTLIAFRNGFGNTTATLYGLGDIRYMYRTDQ